MFDRGVDVKVGRLDVGVAITEFIVDGVPKYGWSTETGNKTDAVFDSIEDAQYDLSRTFWLSDIVW